MGLMGAIQSFRFHMAIKQFLIYICLWIHLTTVQYRIFISLLIFYFLVWPDRLCPKYFIH